MTSSEEFNCLFCQDTFVSKEELQTHFRKHGDPKFNQSLKTKLQGEMAASADKVEELEVVNCDVCEEVFPTISKAITHKHKMHPDHDAKYFCPWCGKLFTMKHLYNKHIQTTHNSKEQSGQIGFHCDYCNVDFFVPSAMVYHNKFFHRQDTELAAIGHSKKLKMFCQEPLQIYYCPFCGEEYCNKVNLHKHMGDDHIDENQSPEDVLRCPLCEAVFYHLDAYELHLTFHSSDDQYSEENELLKEITEFSLETVPPMMEKVENESQDDEPVGSIGIEELLLQGMNDSNDCDSNSEPKKKKKHKKHKKSKKTITLDEFLNMHSDVLGEDLDVQGIVEVPSQVVTKQLRKPQQQKSKPGIKPELAKLKKAGIVVKKKPTPFKGMKIVNRKPIVNTAQVGSKIIPPVQTKSDSKVSSTEILSKLLNQSNSQIKIVKKSTSLSGNTETDISTNRESNEDDSEKDKNGVVKNSTNKLNNENSNEEFENSDVRLESDACSTHDTPSLESDDKQCFIKESAKINQVTKESKLMIETPEKKIDSGKHSNNENDHKESVQFQDSKTIVGKTTACGVDAINTLKNISQHITIKSLSSPRSVQVAPKQPVKDINTDTEVHEGINISNDDPPKNIESPLTALKHLSHLTVKSANQSKNASLFSANKEDFIEKETAQKRKYSDRSDIDEECGEAEFENNLRTENNSDLKDNMDNKTTNALKNLSKTITIKSMTKSPKGLNNATDNRQKSECFTEETLEPKKQVTIKNNTNFKNSGAKLSSPNNSPKVLKPPGENQNNELVVYNPKVQANVNSLKQFTNITGKPVNTSRTITQKITVQSTTQSSNIQKGNILAQSSENKLETKKQEIEIFNIEDSDDENEDLDISSKLKSASKVVEATKIDKSMEVLRNLSKNITIKPKNETNQLKNESFKDDDRMSEDEPLEEDYDDEFDAVSPQKTLENQVNILLQNKLKSLGSISMKSRNNSPKSMHTSPKVKINPHEEGYDSDPDTTSKVKITELPDDYTSDDDVPLKSNKSSNMQQTKYDKNSDNDPSMEDDEDDLEKHIKPCTLRKPTPNLQKTPDCLNNLKNLTVKSFKDNKINQDDNIPDNAYTGSPIIQNKKLTIRQPSIQDTSEDENQESSITARQPIRLTANQNTATSSNQLSTVNKEVTVQTFETETVIEEVTTTVTKTIRKVNQTTNQAVQNVSQKMSNNIRPQTTQGIRPSNQKIKNFQGMSVRPATPVRPRIRNPMMPTRPPATSNVRPSNQLVPMRPNVARLSSPRMPVMKKNITSSNSSHSPVIGKALKISPNAMVPVSKRPAPDETSGPFSCFKKPKESLIPGMVSNSADNREVSGVQFASSSHMSRSNFTSMTKTVKGNSLVTSTQMKSEVCSSSEQVNRLNSMSGLKVVKTSQIKQALKVEERVEADPAKQSALSAIEKLQKQGLLIKKPRIEEPDDSDHSNPDADDDYYDT